jgi:hypothetical protein
MAVYTLRKQLRETIDGDRYFSARYSTGISREKQIVRPATDRNGDVDIRQRAGKFNLRAESIGDAGNTKRLGNLRQFAEFAARLVRELLFSRSKLHSSRPLASWNRTRFPRGPKGRTFLWGERLFFPFGTHFCLSGISRGSFFLWQWSVIRGGLSRPRYRFGLV